MSHILTANKSPYIVIDTVKDDDWMKSLPGYKDEKAIIQRVRDALTETSTKGGPGSGNFGHAGRPGIQGGSAHAGGLSLGVEDIPEDIKKMTFYHGTSVGSYGESIIKDGQIKPGNKKTGGYLKPVEGGVYMASDLDYSLIYALGGDIDTGWPGDMLKNGRYGYIAEMSGSSLKNIQPDEDYIGAHLKDKRYPELTRLADYYLARGTIRKANDGEMAYQARAGKVLAKHLSRSTMLEMIRNGASIANMGPVKVDKVYRVDKGKRWPRVRHLSLENGKLVETPKDVADIQRGKIKDMLEEVSLKGGPGSGNFSHAGRPGLVGGSSPTKGGVEAGRAKSPFGDDKALRKLAMEKLYNTADLNHTANQLDYEICRWDKEHPDGYILTYNPTDKMDPSGYRIYQPISITKDQAIYIRDKAKAAYQKQCDEVSKAIGMPEDYQGLTKAFGLTEDQILHTNAYSSRTQAYDPMLGMRVAQKYVDKIDSTPYSRELMEYGITQKYIDQVNEKYGEDSEEAKNARSYIGSISGDLKDAHDFNYRHAIATGRIEPKPGDTTQGAGSDNHWTPLPKTLYHVTTNSKAVQEGQLMSRRELGMWRNVPGLGGGEDDTISFTEDHDAAKGIERALKEAHAVATGKIDYTSMIEDARDGAGGVGHNWANELMRAVDNNWPDKGPNYDPFKDGMPYAMKRRLDDVANPADEAERQDNLDHVWDFWRMTYSTARDFSHGFMDPLFFGTSRKAVAALDPNEFKTHVYHSKPNSKGYRMAGMGEWRTVGGDTVTLDHAEENYFAQDIYQLRGL